RGVRSSAEDLIAEPFDGAPATALRSGSSERRKARMEKIRVDLGSPAGEVVRLRERHGEVEKRLGQLDRDLSLTPDEQIERSRLKKEKLLTKDRMAALSTKTDLHPQ